MSFGNIRNKIEERRRLLKIKEQVARQLAATPVGRLASEVDRVARTGAATKATADRLRRQLENLAAGASRSAVARTAVARQIEEIERYARNEGGLWNFLKGKLGPVADTIRGLLNPGGQRSEARDVAAAAELLNALGVSTSGANGRRVSVQAEDPKAKADAERVLRGLGFDVQDSPTAPAPGSRPKPTVLPRDRVRPALPPDQSSGMVRKMLGGMFVYFRPDDPIITGEMIPVKSSNVHSIGFIWNDDRPAEGTLKVRFLDSSGGKKSSRGGATYHYYDVHPRVFIEFQKASSKGKFVWDKLRVRGTVSGHQYRYELARLSSSGYVPRQATRIGDEEWYLQRSVKAADGREMRSALKDRMIRQLTPKQKSLPKSMFPNTR